MRVSLQNVNYTGIWAGPWHSHMATFLGSLSPMEESPCFSTRVIMFTHFLVLPLLCLPELPATPQICCVFSYLHASAYAVPFWLQSSSSLWGHGQLQFHSHLSIIGHSTILYGQLDSCYYVTAYLVRSVNPEKINPWPFFFWCRLIFLVRSNIWDYRDGVVFHKSMKGVLEG